MGSVAVAIVCKIPMAGQSKTRLSPPLRPKECAALSACFIQDLAGTIATLTAEGDVVGYALYTPTGSEPDLRCLLPGDFRLIAQSEGDLSTRLIKGTADLFEAGHDGAILINADSPTLPRTILRAAVEATRGADNVVLSPAIDGGYTLIGVSQPHPHLYEDMPWSTDVVYARTLDRAREIGLPVVSLPAWYDIDDAASLRLLEAELRGAPPPCAAPGVVGADAPATRRFLGSRQAVLQSNQ